jgi:hypothetical protein
LINEPYLKAQAYGAAVILQFVLRQVEERADIEQLTGGLTVIDWYGCGHSRQLLNRGQSFLFAGGLHRRRSRPRLRGEARLQVADGRDLDCDALATVEAGA